MKIISRSSLLFAVGICLVLSSGCGQKSSSTEGASYTKAELEAGREKEIKRIKEDKTMPENAKAAAIASVRAQN